jgi:putative effector of murein hydrolase
MEFLFAFIFTALSLCVLGLWLILFDWLYARYRHSNSVIDKSLVAAHVIFTISFFAACFASR